MPSDNKLCELDSALLKDVERLSGCNLAPSDIALRLGVKKSSFLRIWRDPKSEIRESYERGRLKVEEKKSKALKKQIKGGNVTAIQIHNKQAEEILFSDVKNEIFGFEQNHG